jgi:hypothetical protein
MRRFYEANVLNKDNSSAFYGFSNSYLSLNLIFVLCFRRLGEEHVTIRLRIAGLEIVSYLRLDQAR